MSERDRASGFTLVEVLVALVIAFLVLAGAYAFLSGTLRSSARAEETATVAQLAAQLYRALDQDLRNLAPLTSTRGIVVVDPANRPGEQLLNLRRYGRRKLELSFTAADRDGSPPVVTVCYRASEGAAGLSRLSREEEGEPVHAFEGVLAEDVRFDTPADAGESGSFSGRAFVRVMALLVSSGPRAPASSCVLTGLWTLPLARASRKW